MEFSFALQGVSVWEKLIFALVIIVIIWGHHDNRISFK